MKKKIYIIYGKEKRNKRKDRRKGEREEDLES